MVFSFIYTEYLFEALLKILFKKNIFKYRSVKFKKVMLSKFKF
jgi:hypothetical protein